MYTIKVTYAFFWLLNSERCKLLHAQRDVQTYDVHTHKRSPQDGVCLGAASYTQVISQWRLWELHGAQHFWKAERLYLDS